ncbi:MAG: hypothetical protein K8T91_14485, partial [Planctomycetes bacterium]|nr:hypothetical protein [Planctomycetota bacterium]
MNWTGLIPILGMGTIRSTALPQSFTCPICKTSHLQIFDDHVLGGQWAACRACRFAGDLIELAAATWRVEVPAAVLRLGGLDQLSPIPSDEDTESYLRDHIQYRRRLEEFWGRAQKEAGQVANPSIRDLLRSFCLFDLAQSPEWLRRTGRFVGAATAKEVEEILFLYSYQVQPRLNSDGNSTKRRGGGPGGRRIFSGHDWHDLLVVPFYDLPGRICAFLFIGRDGNPIKDFVFKRVNLGRTNLPIREAGVAMLDALGDRQPHDLGNSIFVINDPMIGLILQARHMRSSVFPLPIVLGHYSQDVRSLHALDQYADRKIICWGNGDDALLQAKHLDGLVSSYRINPTEVSEHKLDHDPPHWWLYKIAKRARPWTEALRDELRRRDPLDAEALLRRIALSSSEMELFMRGSSPAEQEWLVRCNPHRVFLRRVVVGGKAILEKNSGWILERSGESICNAPVRLEQLLITTTGEEFYRGFAGPNSKRVRFTISVRDVRRHGLFQCVRDAVMKPGIPMFIYNPCWEKRAEFIATQFQPPEVVPCADRIGWSQDQLSFLFPTFAIRLGGEVQQDSLLLVHHDDVPARHLTSPTSGGPFPSQVAALSAKTNETAILWAMAACVVHNIIAPAMNCEPC